MKYDVFISYSRADYLDSNNNIISDSPIVPILDAFDKNDIIYWIDVDGNNAANHYMTKIANAINLSNFVLFISSEKTNHKDSYWPIKEILLASEKHKEIIPIRIDNSEYHENLVLPLAGLDVIEYYKNPKKAVEKLVKVISNHLVQERKTNISIKQKLSLCFRLLMIVLVAVFLFFSAFATIGACIGYYSNLEDPKKNIDEAFRNNQITILDTHTLQCKGENFCFRYNVMSDRIEFEKNECKLFDEISFENIMMSVSIPIALEKVLITSRRSGNGKNQMVILVGGSIGVLCGYTVGEYIGKSMAVIENESALEVYVNKDLTKDRFKDILMHYIQLNNEE